MDEQLEGRPLGASASQLTELALPNDANILGTLFGGKVMSMVDLAGSLAAVRHSRLPVVTASIDHMNFLQPVSIGELVILRSSVNRVFRTSMEVGVKVWVENVHTGECKHTSSAYLTFVALGEDGKPKQITPGIPNSEEELRRYEEAGERRRYRLEQRDRAKKQW